jgi:hypothetical protein
MEERRKFMEERRKFIEKRVEVYEGEIRLIEEKGFMEKDLPKSDRKEGGYYF